MISILVYLAVAVHTVLSSPVNKNIQAVEAITRLKIDKPSNFYKEKDLDRKVSLTPGGTVTTVRYGPFEIKSMGMLDNVWAYDLPKPCESCYITAMQADLQFEDGKTANIEDGAWLHHTVLYSGLGYTPGSKKDLVCSNTLLSFGMGWPHRIFASGNERTPVRLNSKFKYGMSIDFGEKFHMLYDLVNVSKKATKYYLAITFEHIPKSTPGYRPARMVWTDVTGCGASEAKPLEGTYELRSPGWTSTVGGVMLYTLGHMHDGGVYTTLYVNSKPVCRSDQFYGTKPTFFEKEGVANLSGDEISKMGGMGANHTASANGNKPAQHGHGRSTNPTKPDASALQHISEVSSCTNFGILKPGDTVELGATYDTKAHSMNRAMHGHSTDSWGGIVAWLTTPDDEKFAPIMGINPLYIGEGQMTL